MIFLNQIIYVPTRANKIVDLVLEISQTIAEDLEIGEDLGNSDHKIIRLQFYLINKLLIITECFQILKWKLSLICNFSIDKAI